MVSECFLNYILDCFVPFSGIEWYFKLPLRVSLSLAEISLNGPMVCNSNQWCTIGFFVRETASSSNIARTLPERGIRCIRDLQKKTF